MAETVKPDGKRPMAEIGVAGLKVASGYIFEEYLPQLRGMTGIRVYQEMSLNDATAGAVLHAIGLAVRSVAWDVTPAEPTPEAEGEAEFVKSLMDDMSHSWSDFIAEAMTMLVYGWAWHEIVWKRRSGPDGVDPSKRSRFTDGRIGVRKLAPRSQDSLSRWEMQDDGGISGMWQQPPMGGGLIFLPIERGLLFRTVSRKNSPEGMSILRTAYRSWYKLKNVEDFESIGIERELAGLPVIRIPKQYLTSTDPADMIVRGAYEKIARDVRLNEQGGIVIPSDTYTNPDGSISTVPLVEVALLNSGGTRTIDTDRVAQRHQRNIARSCLADFLMLGEGSGTAKGSYGMHEGKVDLFMQSVEALLEQIESPLNRFLLPRLWKLNGLDPALMPQIRHGKAQPANLASLGQFISDVTAAGMALFPDEETESFVRRSAGLPLKTAERSL